jgi:hypothetical protein
MDSAEHLCLSTKISELEYNFAELSENVVNLEKDVKKLVQIIELSTYSRVEIGDNK